LVCLFENGWETVVPVCGPAGGPAEGQNPTRYFDKNRFAVLNHRDRSSSSVRGESPAKRSRDEGKRSREESVERTDRNLAFKSMADEEEKFRKAKEIVGKVRLSMTAAVSEGLKGPIVDVLNGIVEWMDITTGVQEVTANVVVDSFNKVASPPRKSRKESVRTEPTMQEKEEAEEAASPYKQMHSTPDPR
jgi:hypothetical protein